MVISKVMTMVWSNIISYHQSRLLHSSLPFHLYPIAATHTTHHNLRWYIWLIYIISHCTVWNHVTLYRITWYHLIFSPFQSYPIITRHIPFHSIPSHAIILHHQMHLWKKANKEWWAPCFIKVHSLPNSISAWLWYLPSVKSSALSVVITAVPAEPKRIMLVLVSKVESLIYYHAQRYFSIVRVYCL